MENNKNTDKKSVRLKTQQKLSGNSENISDNENMSDDP
jgi:hypothetical protein